MHSTRIMYIIFSCRYVESLNGLVSWPPIAGNMVTLLNCQSLRRLNIVAERLENVAISQTLAV